MIFLIAFLDCSLLVHRNAAGFVCWLCFMLLCRIHLLALTIFLCGIFRFFYIRSYHLSTEIILLLPFQFGCLVLGWPKSLHGFFHKIKDMFFSFSPMTLLIWIFWVCQLSPAWYNVDFSQLILDLMAINFNQSTQPWSIIQWESSSTKRCKPLLTHSISHSPFFIHCTNLFMCFSCIFSFLNIIKQNMLKMLHIFFHLQY